MKLLNIEDSYTLITEKARAAEVLFVPGRVFYADDTKATPYIRVSYSVVSPELMDKVCSIHSSEVGIVISKAKS